MACGASAFAREMVVLTSAHVARMCRRTTKPRCSSGAAASLPMVSRSTQITEKKYSFGAFLHCLRTVYTARSGITYGEVELCRHGAFLPNSACGHGLYTGGCNTADWRVRSKAADWSMDVFLRC